MGMASSYLVIAVGLSRKKVLKKSERGLGSLKKKIEPGKESI